MKKKLIIRCSLVVVCLAIILFSFGFWLSSRENLNSINKTTKYKLESIYGIGDKRSTEIISHMPYSSWDEVKSKTKGISDKTIFRLKLHYYISNDNKNEVNK